MQLLSSIFGNGSSKRLDAKRTAMRQTRRKLETLIYETEYQRGMLKSRMEEAISRCTNARMGENMEEASYAQEEYRSTRAELLEVHEMLRKLRDAQYVIDSDLRRLDFHCETQSSDLAKSIVEIADDAELQDTIESDGNQSIFGRIASMASLRRHKVNTRARLRQADEDDSALFDALAKAQMEGDSESANRFLNQLTTLDTEQAGAPGKHHESRAIS